MARAVGINHVALEVGDIDEALAFYRQLFDFELRGRHGDRMAFIDLGDQFLALTARTSPVPDEARHFGLVVDDKRAVRRKLEEARVEISPGPRLDFRDPWGNNVEVVDYRDIQFTKAPNVAAALGIDGLEKTEQALAELREKGLV